MKDSDESLLPEEKSLSTEHDSPRLRRKKNEPPTHISGLWLVLLTICALSSLILIGYSFCTKQLDSKECNMAYMYPSYHRLHGFDLEHTRFAQKYSLYLYREQTIDFSNQPQGVPVLFVPGNAGSYKQIRPIAAEAAAQFQESSKDHPEVMEAGKRSLDFFTVDFNEDFSAFHGQTMLDQAEYLNSAITYILSMYTDARKSPSDKSFPDPTSVILIGHSMGGIVARTMQRMPNYLPKSINTIVTMSTPHALPPAPFDAQIQRIYEDINTYWRNTFSNHTHENPLQDVSLVSIAGGGLDTIVSSDYTSVRTIVPPSNGFTVFTSTIPLAWTSADHQAILWCDQFRKVLARVLLEIVDARRGTQTIPVDHRIAVFQDHLLSRLDRQEFSSSQDRLPRSTHAFDSVEAMQSHVVQGDLYRRIVRDSPESLDLLPIPDSLNGTLQLLTNLESTGSDSASYIAITLCRRDITLREATSSYLICMDMTKDATVLPSEQDLKHKGNFDRHLYYQFDLTAFANQDFIAIRTRSGYEDMFVAAFFQVSSPLVMDITTSPASLFPNGRVIKRAPSALWLSVLHFPSITSSIIAYKIRLSTPHCTRRTMASITRQHTRSPYETKYFVGKQEIDISLHGQSPFFPPVSIRRRGLTIHHWSDPACPSPTEIHLSLDYLGSIGKLVMRYRVVLVAFPLAIALIVFTLQLRTYQRLGSYITFQQGLRLFLGRPLLCALLLISATTISLIKRQSSMVLLLETFFHDPSGPKYVMSLNDLLLGSQDLSLWWLAPIFVLICTGLLNVVSLGLTAIIITTSSMLELFESRNALPVEHNNARSSIRRLITTLILLIVVATIVPYQFAYVVACMVELVSCIRLYGNRQAERSHHTTNIYNFNFSVLLLMICVLPISIPILVVWVRNLAVHWLTPFSTHHNILSVAPLILLVECLTSGTIAPPNDTWLEIVLNFVILAMAGLTILWGVMYTYLLHHFLNVLALVLFLYHHFASTFYNQTFTSAPRYKRISKQSSTSSTPPSPSPPTANTSSEIKSNAIASPKRSSQASHKHSSSITASTNKRVK